MEKIQSFFENIFASYKRTAAILFIAGIALSIPFTLSLLNQTQDIRQRAAETDTIRFNSGYVTISTTPGESGPNQLDSSTNTATQESTPIHFDTEISITTTPGEPTPFHFGSETNGSSSASVIDINVKLTGIGASSSAGFNNHPKRPERNVFVEVYDTSGGKIVSDLNQLINFDPISGYFKGRINLEKTLSTGSYLMKVKMDNTLWKATPIRVETSGILTTYYPTIDLISGDIDQNNRIDLQDYNLLISCSRDKTTCQIQ